MVLGERLQVLRQNAFAAERRVTDRQTRLSEFIYKIGLKPFLKCFLYLKKSSMVLVQWKCDILCGTTKSCFHPYLNYLFSYPNPLHLWKYLGFLTKNFTFKYHFSIDSSNLST
jgi:hypothetical protein